MSLRAKRSNLIFFRLPGSLKYFRLLRRVAHGNDIVLCSAILLSSFLCSSCDRGITPGVLRFSNFWSEPGQRAVMDSVIAEFKNENPEIPVEVSELSWGDGKTKLMINFNARTAPDVIEFGSDWVPEFSSSGVLEDISSNDSLRARELTTPEYAREPGIWKSKLFAVPWFVDTRVLFINADLLVKDDSNLLGSWDGILQAGSEVKKRGLGNGVGVNSSDAHRLYKKILPQIWSNGGDILDSNGNPTFARKENIEALTYYVKQLDAGVLETQKNLDDLFKRGKLAILFSGAWLLQPLGSATFHWQCVPFPGNNGHQGISFAGGEYLAINSATEMQPQAERLVAFLTRPNIELRLAKAFNIFPANSMLQHDDFYSKRNQGPVFIEQLKNARMTPNHPRWLEIEAILEDETAQALYKKKTPEEALKSCDIRVAELLKEP
ncbi:MAG TPA: extracellular solute-binding protein [Candidatus Kapabacteria bacterium]|nr:extracellular solute-binding protein [Candidatus Kapabacteria bacterium]